MENTEAIRHNLQDYRREALGKFIGEFMKILQEEGYTYEDLLHAVTDWADTQELQLAVGHLEKAIGVVHGIAVSK